MLCLLYENGSSNAATRTTDMKLGWQHQETQRQFIYCSKALRSRKSNHWLRKRCRVTGRALAQNHETLWGPLLCPTRLRGFPRLNSRDCQLSHYVSLYLCRIMSLEAFFLSLHDLRLIQSSKPNSRYISQASSSGINVISPSRAIRGKISWVTKEEAGGGFEPWTAIIVAFTKSNLGFTV